MTQMIVYNNDINDEKTLGELFQDYFEEHRHDIPGSSAINVSDTNDLTVINKMISLAGLDFLTWLSGSELYQNITDDKNLNAEIIDQFAQTFIRQFWTYQPGYGNDLVFAARLRAFFDQYLPIWAEYYRELIVNNGGYVTNSGQITVSGNNSLHFVQSNSQNGTVNSQTNDRGSTNTVSNGTSNNVTDSSGATDTDTSTLSNGSSNAATNENKKISGQENSVQNNLQATADTPQNQLNVPLEGGVLDDYDSDGNRIPSAGSDPTEAYQFDYASSVQGNSNKGGKNSFNKENNDTTTKASTSESSETKGSSQSNDHAESKGKTNNSSDTTSQNSQSVVTNSNQSLSGEHTQTGMTGENTKMNQRTLPVYEIALGLNKIANGAYNDLFLRAKRYGLFMLDYL